MVIKIDLDRARELLAEVVAEAGEEFVYTDTCNYVVPDAWRPESEREPGCIVGRVLAKAGVPVEVIGLLDDDKNYDYPKDFDGPKHDTSFPYAMWAIPKGVREVLDVEEQAVEYLTSAQQVQDSRKTWGRALAAAEATVGT